MERYKDYPTHVIFVRRAFAVTAGVLALPVMLF
ncbi:putative periplasmic protein [Salmonella enterica subsp. arizonae]|nr:putative periplasmic protein [Salmonella enterica subsp. arizonae]